jgi:hypothetical protein
MANVNRLKRFSYQSIVKRYAILFGLDPDYVFDNTSMDTVLGMLEEQKEEDEFGERYNHFYQRMSAIK